MTGGPATFSDIRGRFIARQLSTLLVSWSFWGRLYRHNAELDGFALRQLHASVPTTAYSKSDLAVGLRYRL